MTAALSSSASAANAPEFALSIPPERSAQPLDGRLLLLLSTDPSDEPRNQIDDTPRYADRLRHHRRRPEARPAVDRRRQSAWGYPVHSLQDVPPGEYYVQALLT